jgi:hypothetical protein
MTRSQMNSITDSRIPCSSNSTGYPVLPRACSHPIGRYDWLACGDLRVEVRLVLLPAPVGR